jgi:hypothetical protein
MHPLGTDILNPSIGLFLPARDLRKVAATVAKSNSCGVNLVANMPVMISGSTLDLISFYKL